LGLDGQYLVQPGGTIIVPIDNANESAVLAFTSTNGGGSWCRQYLQRSLSVHWFELNFKPKQLTKQAHHVTIKASRVTFVELLLL
jgi:hypothetical protein